MTLDEDLVLIKGNEEGMWRFTMFLLELAGT